MSSIKITHTKTALPKSNRKLDKYRAWGLTSSATEAVETDGTMDDPDVFVMRINKTALGNRDVFSHVASLYEMTNLPSDSSDVPPKSGGMYRSSMLKMNFQNELDLDEAIENIDSDVRLLMYAATSTVEVIESSITSSIGPTLTFPYRYFGTSSVELASLSQADLDGFESEEGNGEGHSGTVYPNDEYIYVVYPAIQGMCHSFVVDGFTTDPWVYRLESFLNPEGTGQDYVVYKSTYKLQSTEGANYEIR